MKNNYRFIKELLKLRMSHLMAFRLGFFGPLFVDVSLFFIQLLVFQAIFSNVDRIGSWGQGEMIIFIGTFSLVDAINMTVYFFGVLTIPDKVRTGEMDLYLTKPVSPLLRITFEKVNPGTLPQLLFSVGVIAYGVSVGGFQIGMIQVIGYILFIAIMTLLFYDLEIMLRTTSFFIISTTGILKLEEAGLDLCMKIPGVIFQRGFKIFFYAILPYGLIATLPTQVLTSSLSVPGIIFGMGIVAVFTALMLWFWKLGLRHYNSASS